MILMGPFFNCRVCYFIPLGIEIYFDLKTLV